MARKGAKVPRRPAASELAGSARLEVRRVVPAKREVVYDLWTDANRMPGWLLDGGSAKLDVRVGGKYHWDMMYLGKTYPMTACTSRSSRPSVWSSRGSPSGRTGSQPS